MNESIQISNIYKHIIIGFHQKLHSLTVMVGVFQHHDWFQSGIEGCVEEIFHYEVAKFFILI